MKVTTLKIQNIGIIEDVNVEIGKPLIVFYGDICQGKTTVLNAVKWVCGGEFPADILRHGKKEGFIELGIDGGYIRREFYLAKDSKEVKARQVEFVRDGRPVNKPVAEIERLLNPFSFNQNYLAEMKDAERNRFFVELFGVSTVDLDTKIATVERSASALRSELKGFGEIDLTKYERVNTADLMEERDAIVGTCNERRRQLNLELDEIVNKFGEETRKYDEALTLANTRLNGRNSARQNLTTLEDEINQLQERIKKLAAKSNEIGAWLAANPELEKPIQPEVPKTAELRQKIEDCFPDTSKIDVQINEAGAANARAEQYEKNLEREKQRKDKADALNGHEMELDELRKKKVERLKTLNDSCKIEGLKFRPDLEFEFEGTTASMLSTSQIMRLSKLLSDLYPPGLNVQLLDRAESLGSSIFKLIERAKSEDKTILAAVVGEKPAAVPENVGVFVVEKGKVS